MLYRPSRAWLWIYFAVNTPTIVATVDAAVAATIVALLILDLANVPLAGVVAGGVVAFAAIWCALFLVQLQSLRRLGAQAPKFPTPPDLG